MDGHNQIERLIEKIKPLQEELNAARDVVAEYSNNVYESIYVVNRTIHAREAVRHLDFSRELFSLALSHLEQSLEWQPTIPVETLPKHED